VSPLYVYAYVAAEPRNLGAGLAGEPLRLARCQDVMAVIGPMEAAPAISPEALAAHDAVVRQLAEEVEAILPARFGEAVRDEGELTSHLAPRSRELAEALEQVRGCVQMTLRVFGAPDRPAEEVTVEGGPGTRYLAARRQEHERAASLPEIEPLREILRPLIRAERSDRRERRWRRETGPLLGSVYHLVRKEDLPAYLAAVRETEGRLGGRRFTFSGPWPPYAFAPRFGDPR
jgi:hypothetical protein